MFSRDELEYWGIGIATLLIVAVVGIAVIVYICADKITNLAKKLFR